MSDIEQKFENLKKALASLENSVATPPVEERDYGGIIQAFVSVYELTWKLLKILLEKNGISAPFPRVVFEEAFKAGLLEGNEVWKEILEAGNLATHTYDKKLAVQLCADIKTEYLSIFKKTSVKILGARRDW